MDPALEPELARAPEDNRIPGMSGSQMDEPEEFGVPGMQSAEPLLLPPVEPLLVLPLVPDPLLLDPEEPADPYSHVPLLRAEEPNNPRKLDRADEPDSSEDPPALEPGTVVVVVGGVVVTVVVGGGVVVVVVELGGGVVVVVGFFQEI